MHILHILHILHIFPFQYTESFLFKTSGLLDSDDSDPESLPSPTRDLPSPTRDSPVPPSNDSEGPASEAPDQAPLPPVQAQPPRSLPPVDMIQTMQASGGPGFLIAAKGLDARMPDTARRVPSARAGGETRTQSLKRKAEHISRSACEIFAFCTSETVSQEGTAKLLSAVGNVSCT